MSVDKKKRTVAQEALADMEAIVSSIKESSKNTLSAMLNEQVKNALRDGCSENDEDDTEIVQGGEDNSGEDNTGNDTETGDENGSMEQDSTEDDNNPDLGTEDGTQDGDGNQEDAATDDSEEWDEFDNYKVGDNTYDLTGEQDFDKVVKVFKLLSDDDEVAVKHDGDTVKITDNTNGSEYIIDLGTEDNAKEGVNESDDIAGIPSFDDNMDSGSNVSGEDFDYDDEEDPTAGDNADFDNDTEMKDDKDMVFEIDLGYTDNYQDKDPIAGLSNQETSKSGKNWDKGVPTGTQKPFAGSTEGKAEPFEKPVNEEDNLENTDEPSMEEGTNVGGAVQQRTSSKSHIPANRKDYGPKAKRHVSTGGEYEEIVAEMKKIQEENKALKKAVLEFKKNLTEAYVTNVNLGKITKLFLENATTQSEKVDIVNRFAKDAKTPEQAEMLYESVKRELEGRNAGNNGMPNLNSTSATANGTQALNESKQAYKSSGWCKTLDLMQRMENL